MNGLFDTHCHILPGIDDGCETLAASLDCARALVAAGYTRVFCTPHIWPNLAHFNRPGDIAAYVGHLQRALDNASVPLKLFPGGELSMRPEWLDMTRQEIVTYNLQDRFCLFDIWIDEIPPFFEPCVRFLQNHGLKVILAHPERMRVTQAHPEVMDWFADIGLVFQGNLQCFGDPDTAITRQLAERFLREGRYFVLGSDAHNLRSFDIRLRGLARVRQIADEATIRRLMVENPATLLG
ncbi:MAG: CpsB/CapC family capsule biosynthesis tyrosine phosphatase [Tepidisphaeraceae bacterium]|jgi:protein-tyrosine phosphatase